MFKDSSIFEFDNFQFKAKYNNTEVYFVNGNYLFYSLIKSTTVYL